MSGLCRTALRMSRLRYTASCTMLVRRRHVAMTAQRLLALSLMLTFCVAAKHKPATQADVSQIYFEVQALSTLNDLEVTADQLNALKGMASVAAASQALQVAPKVAG